jgi:hypothetical protein
MHESTDLEVHVAGVVTNWREEAAMLVPAPRQTPAVSLLGADFNEFTHAMLSSHLAWHTRIVSMSPAQH